MIIRIRMKKVGTTFLILRYNSYLCNVNKKG